MMMRVRLAAAVMVFICASSAAAADDFSRECPADSYMTGFEGTAGAWIDTMRILCARWNAKREKFDEPIKIREMAGRSNGGNWTSAPCPDQWVVAGSYRPNFVWGDDGDVPVLHSIEFYCRPVDDKRSELRIFGSTSSVADRAPGPIMPDCNEAYGGLFATGIAGSHRRFVEGFRFICSAAPNAPAIKGTKPIGSVKQPGGPRFNERKGGSVIASGETAPPPPPPPPPPPAPAQQTATAKENVDIYNDINNEPGDTVIGMLGKNSTVPVLGHDNEKHWYRLQIGNGVGWVAANWLTIKP